MNATETLADLEAQIRREIGELCEGGVSDSDAKEQVETRYVEGLVKWRRLAAAERRNRAVHVRLHPDCSVAPGLHGVQEVLVGAQAGSEVNHQNGTITVRCKRCKPDGSWIRLTVGYDDEHHEGEETDLLFSARSVPVWTQWEDKEARN